MYLKHFLLCIMLIIAVSACKKDPVVPPVLPVSEPEANAALVISFKAIVNGKDWTSPAITYTNTSGDKFTVSKFSYFVSHVKLKKKDGTYYEEKDSYHLVKHAIGQTTFTLTGIPSGEYTQVEFLIGVDSTRNVSGAQTGALDQGNDMFWDWNTGYIFFKLEGMYSSALVSEAEGYAIHIGGFTGEFNCLQTCIKPLPSPFTAQSKKQGTLFINTHIDEIFNNPVKFGFDYYYSNINLKTFQLIAANYKDMFSLERIEN